MTCPRVGFLVTLLVLVGCTGRKASTPDTDTTDTDAASATGPGTAGTATSSDSADTATTPPVTNYGPQATFRIDGEQVSYRQSTGNLISCTQDGDALHLRFAEETGFDGEDGARLDIGVCHYVGAGPYTVHDPWAYPCGDGATFDIRWRATPSNGWVNRIDSSPCTLELVGSTASRALSGTFACRPLENILDPVQTIELTEGSFRCTIALVR